ncbi:MAG: antitoxin VapB family protein [Spirochaetia bacterium]|jgi:predicted CopG family antitoxin|nr:antitoxin VapB family protein [Spirochaetia bacterium]
MAVKTITIDMEAYDLLSKARTGSESFSKVIKHILGPAGKDAQSLLASLNSIRVSEPVLDALEQVVASRDTDWLAAEHPGLIVESY